jgi:hypothetical protein
MEFEEYLLPLKLPCGGEARFDFESGISYHCERCGAVIGSIGQLQHCKDEDEKYRLMKRLGGKGWDYRSGGPEK